jgi:hypothetical protein
VAAPSSGFNGVFIYKTGVVFDGGIAAKLTMSAICNPGDDFEFSTVTVTEAVQGIVVQGSAGVGPTCTGARHGFHVLVFAPAGGLAFVPGTAYVAVNLDNLTQGTSYSAARSVSLGPPAT